MAYLLHIDASPREEHFHSRHMTCEFVQQWKQQHPNDAIAYRDRGRNPIAHVDTGNVCKPLVFGKKMYIIEAREDTGFQPGGRYQTMNHNDPYLVTAFGFMGITDITFIHVENDDYGGQKLTESIANACHKIEIVAA